MPTADAASSALLVVASDEAGSTEREAVEAAVRALSAERDVELRWTAEPQELDDALDALAGRALVVAGGDGSLHLAVARLRARDQLDVPVGLIPLGTGNDFARGIGLPLDAEDAARALLSSSARPVDLLVTDAGDVVVNAAHAGLGAAASEAASGLKPALGPVAYPLGAVLAGVREQGFRLTVELDGRVVHDGPTLMVGIANGCSIGGGAQLCASARIDDGRLDVVVVSAVGPAARIAFASALHRGTHLEREDVAAHQGEVVTVSGEAVRHVLDGELSEECDALTYRVVPHAWRLLG